MPLDLKPEQRKKLLDQCRDHYESMKGSRGDWDTRHEERWRRFYADPTLRPEGPWRDAPKIFTTHTRRTTERILAEIWQALFGTDESLMQEPFGEEDVPRAELATRFHRWTLSTAINDVERGGWQYLGQMAMLDALVDGVGILKVYPWKTPWPAPKEGGRWLETLIRIDVVDQEYLLTPPGVKGLQYPDCPYLAEEMYVRYDDLLRRKAGGWEVPDEDDLRPQERPLSQKEQADRELHGETSDEPEEQILVVGSYERFVVDDKLGLEEDVVVHWYPDAAEETPYATAERLIDLFPQPDRPRHPYFPIVIWPLPRQWRGLNVPDRLEVPQDMVNRLLEQMVNYGDLSLLPFIFANVMVTGDIPDLTQVKPGAIVPLNDSSGIQFVQRSSSNRHFIEQLQYEGGEIEQDVHVSDFSQGRQPDRPNAPRTFGATALLLEQSRRSFGILIKHLAPQFEAALSFHFRLWQARIQPGLRLRLPKGFGLPPTSAQAPQPAASAGLFSPMASPPMGNGQIAPAAPEGMALSVPPASPPALMPNEDEVAAVINRLFTDATHPEEPSVAVEITKEHLSGLFDAKLQVNPDATFDRQLLLNLGQQMLPILQQMYPLGVQRFLKRVWALHGLKGFEQLFPTDVAEVATKLLLSRAMLELRGLEQQQQMQEIAGLMQQLAPLLEGQQNEAQAEQDGQAQAMEQQRALGEAQHAGEMADLERQVAQAEAEARIGQAGANLSRSQLQALAQVFKLVQQYQQMHQAQTMGRNGGKDSGA